MDPILAVKAACHHAARYFLLNNRGAIADAQGEGGGLGGLQVPVYMLKGVVAHKARDGQDHLAPHLAVKSRRPAFHSIFFPPVPRIQNRKVISPSGSRCSGAGRAPQLGRWR